MQSANGQHAESPRGRFDRRRCCGPRKYAIYSQSLNDNFLRGRAWVCPENIASIEIGDCYAEAASAQFCGEEIPALQEIRTMQRETESDTHQVSGG
jgi:hypothetical protein